MPQQGLGYPDAALMLVKRPAFERLWGEAHVCGAQPLGGEEVRLVNGFELRVDVLQRVAGKRRDHSDVRAG